MESPCCKAKIKASIIKLNYVGHCGACGELVVRQHRFTGVVEWLAARTVVSNPRLADAPATA